MRQRSLLEIADDLAQFGLGIEAFGGGAIAVRETPAILGEVNADAMLAISWTNWPTQAAADRVQSKVEAILSRVACHGSIRTGRGCAAKR